MAPRGYTAIEIIIVIGIMGIVMVTAFPSIINSMETRNLDNCARNIQTVMEQAKNRAVSDKLLYRVRFVQSGSTWNILLEYQSASTAWSAYSGFHTQMISSAFVTTVNLPTSASGGQEMQVSPVGLVQGYDSTKNSVTVQSTKLLTRHQPDLRILRVYAGGSIQYIKTSS